MSLLVTSRLSSFRAEVPLTDQPSTRAINLKACWCPAQSVQHSRRCVSTFAADHPRHTSALSAGLFEAAADGHQRRFAEQQPATDTTGAATAHPRRARRRCISAHAAGHPRHVSPLDAALFEGAADGRLERLLQEFLVKLAGRDWNDWSQNAGTALLCWVLRAPTLAIFGSLLALTSFRLSVLALAIVFQVSLPPVLLYSFLTILPLAALLADAHADAGIFQQPAFAGILPCVQPCPCSGLPDGLSCPSTERCDAEGTHSPTGSFNS